MAARTCSRAVTQTARKGAHQGAARRQARKMLRQVSDPIKNNGASSKHCYAAQGRWLPCRIRPGIRGQRTAARQVRNIATKGKSDATACRSGLAQGRGPERFRLAAGRPLSSCCLRFFSSRRRTCRAYPSPDVRASLFSSLGVALRTGILSALQAAEDTCPVIGRDRNSLIPQETTLSRARYAQPPLLSWNKKQGGASAPPCQ